MSRLEQRNNPLTSLELTNTQEMNKRATAAFQLELANELPPTSITRQGAVALAGFMNDVPMRGSFVKQDGGGDYFCMATAGYDFFKQSPLSAADRADIDRRTIDAV